MTTLIKLGIQGVRSFNPDSPEILEFEKPVTLIVGQNGAGKTTIIECLKMVAAGQLPPNCDKGHGFIHDPNLARVPEVKAQIRLLFRSPNNHQICAIRSFQLTNTKGKGSSSVKSTFRALEGIVKTREAGGGAESSVTKKCADMDALVPALMGVSRAVLDSVIFCHQEEANWPLTEKIALKKKFDDIFGSARYTKALEAIEKSRKEYMKESKEKMHAFELLEKDAEAAKTLHAQVSQLTASRYQLMSTTSSLSLQIADLQATVSTFEAQDSKQAEVRFLLTQKEATLANLKSEADDIAASLPEVFTEQIDRLRSHLAKLESHQVPEAAMNLVSARHAFVTNEQGVSKAQCALSELRLASSDKDVDALSAQKDQLNKVMTDLTTLTGWVISDESNVEELLKSIQVSRMQLDMECSRKEASAREAVVAAERRRFVIATERDKLQAQADQVFAIRNMLDRECSSLDDKIGTAAAFELAAVNAADAEDELAALELELEAAVELRGKLGLRLPSPVVAAEPGESLEEFLGRLSLAQERLTLLHAEHDSAFADTVRIDANMNRIQTRIDEAGKKADRISCFQKVVDSQKELAMAECAKVLYGKMKDKSLEKAKCQFCKRKFQGELETQTFENAVSELTSQLPKLLLDLTARLQKAHSDLDELGSKHRSFIDDDEKGQLLRDLASASLELGGANDKVSSLAAAQKKIENEISEMVSQIPHKRMSTDACVSREELIAAADNEKRLRQAKAQAAAKFANLNSIAQRASLVAESLGADQIRLQEVLFKKAEQDVALSSIESALQAAAANYMVAEEEYTRAANVAQETAVACRQELDAFEFKASEINENVQVILVLRREIEKASDKLHSGPSREKIKELTELEGVLISRRAELHQAVNAAETQVSELENVRMLLTRNISLKSIFAEIQSIEAEIADMRSRFNSTIADGLAEARRRLIECRDQRSRAEGELAQINDQIRFIEAKLSSPLYRDIGVQVEKAWIRREAAETAVRDLQRYHTALDKALMKYHVHKMSEINAAIATLWHSVYHGNDIDCIAIRSDVEEEGEPGKRSYNYRVVLINGDVELDMRGRCSAGQKVLASIIIRLALAESFCHNCGILALDEPTTNLDKANIQGLAAALCKLIESRRHHRNFQLIVITHDEEFVRVLSRLQVCDTYYRVTKDPQGYSRIRRNVIHEIQ